MRGTLADIAARSRRRRSSAPRWCWSAARLRRKNFATARSTIPTYRRRFRGGAAVTAGERRPPDQIAVAVEHRDLDGDAAALQHLAGLRLRGLRHPLAERDAFLRGIGKGFGRGVGGRDLRRQALQRRRPRAASAASPSRSTAPRLECRSSMPCASLVILATPPAMVTRGTGCGRRYFSMPPTKSPMSMSAVSGRPWSFCTAASEVGAGRARDMGRAPSRARRRCRDGSSGSRPSRNTA